jgi:hypothetical protein
MSVSLEGVGRGGGFWESLVSRAERLEGGFAGR